LTPQNRDDILQSNRVILSEAKDHRIDYWSQILAEDNRFNASSLLIALPE
jgi:hypothetical protein